MENKIYASEEWLDFVADKLIEAKRKVAQEVYELYGNSVRFPMFLHVDLCNAVHTICASAPNKEEALKFINEARDEVIKNFESKWK